MFLGAAVVLLVVAVVVVVMAVDNSQLVIMAVLLVVMVGVAVCRCCGGCSVLRWGWCRMRCHAVDNAVSSLFSKIPKDSMYFGKSKKLPCSKFVENS